MRVLGIDPGIGTTGCAVVKKEGNDFTLLFSQGITTPTSLPMPERLSVLYQEIKTVLKKFKPEVAALETLFFNTNVTTAFLVGQARGVVLLAVAQEKIMVSEYNPMEVKVALTGYGAAKKMQIAKMVAQILKLTKIISPDDASDAAAIALTHCFSYKISNLR